MPKCKYKPFLITENKYEIGDKVLYTIDKEKCRYCGETSDNLAILEDKNEYLFRVNYNHLSPLKKKDELKIGDKFIGNTNIKYEILAVGYDNFNDSISYFVKKISGHLKGITSTKWPEAIKEIIYD